VAAAVLADASIANFYVMDMRIKRRRPITPEEFAMLRQFVEVRDRVKRKYLKEQRELRALSAQFRRQLGYRNVDSYEGIRLPYKGDYSGLVPVSRRVGAVRKWNNPRATLRRHGQGSTEGSQARHAERLRQPVRVHAARPARVR
jgi:hypothetical protein